jgi:hypothetical protein
MATHAEFWPRAMAVALSSAAAAARRAALHYRCGESAVQHFFFILKNVDEKVKTVGLINIFKKCWNIGES